MGPFYYGDYHVEGGEGGGWLGRGAKSPGHALLRKADRKGTNDAQGENPAQGGEKSGLSFRITSPVGTCNRSPDFLKGLGDRRGQTGEIIKGVGGPDRRRPKVTGKVLTVPEPKKKGCATDLY